MNNNAVCDKGDRSALFEKAECLAHFTYERSEEEAMLLDIQGCEYRLIDPEITNDVVKETPPQAPPAAITSPTIVPEPQVPIQFPLHYHSTPIHDPRCGLLCPPSIEIHKFSAAAQSHRHLGQGNDILWHDLH